ncbi:MAG: hypothetical protein ACI9RO_000929 [Alteromonas macleodii]
MSPEVKDKWLADTIQTPGGQPTYPDMTISICQTLSTFFKNLVADARIARLMELDVPVPDFSTLLWRSAGLSMSKKSKAQRAGPIGLIVDSMDQKIFHEGEWLQKKYKTKVQT